MTTRKLSELDKLYLDADSAAQDLQAEQKNNLMLVAGLHYHSQTKAIHRTLERNDRLSKTQKIRLTKNHIQKITKLITNAFLQYSGTITCSPNNEAELADVKAAEMYNDVRKSISKQVKWPGFRRKMAKDLSEIGECCVLLSYDPNGGKILRYEPKLDEFLQPKIGIDGKEVPDINKPIYSGIFNLDRIHGFNLLIDPEAMEFEKARHVIIREMFEVSKLKRMYAHDPEKVKGISKSSETVYKVFNTQTGEYEEGEGLTMVRRFFFRPNDEYPNGYYYYATPDVVLEEGELPFGVFPVEFEAYDDISTNARGYSIIKQLRPYQAEINRVSSLMCQQQVTLGPDRVLIASGTTIKAGGSAHGVKSIKYSGMKPEIMAGRDGSNFIPYLDHEISEMYSISPVQEEYQEKQDGQIDPYAMLFKSIKQKKKFSIYSEKFQEFEERVWEKIFELARGNLTDEQIIAACGRREIANIPEFRRNDSLRYMIDVESNSEDFESKLGKQLSLNHALQYIGPSLEPDERGKLLRAMPYLNKEEGLSDASLDWDLAKNMILALDRGDMPKLAEGDNFAYLGKRLSVRMREPDYKYLDQNIQKNYSSILSQCEEYEAIRIEKVERAKAGLIPATGQLVSVDMYVPHTNSKGQPTQKRMRIWSDAILWTYKKLQDQGNTTESVDNYDPAFAAGVGEKFSAKHAPQNKPAQDPRAELN